VLAAAIAICLASRMFGITHAMLHLRFASKIHQDELKLIKVAALQAAMKQQQQQVT
jgi:hypothetical protein